MSALRPAVCNRIACHSSDRVLRAGGSARGGPRRVGRRDGQFSSGKRTLELDGAYAFWSKSATPNGGEVIKVAVSNAEFGEGFFDDYYDREHAIDTIFFDADAKVVYFLVRAERQISRPFVLLRGR
jgi:hypothetical protein